MNVFDFDGTIYEGDSSVDFVRYCMRTYPRLWRYIPEMLVAYGQYRRGKDNKTLLKEHLFRFVEQFDDLQAVVDDFWKGHFENVMDWYRDVHQESDVIVSASPAFLENSLLELLHVQAVVATRVDPRTGKIDGINCRNAEKVRRFRELFPDAVIEKAYGNSDGDYEMACEAREAYLVKDKAPRLCSLDQWPRG